MKFGSYLHATGCDACASLCIFVPAFANVQMHSWRNDNTGRKALRLSDSLLQIAVLPAASVPQRHPTAAACTVLAPSAVPFTLVVHAAESIV